MLALPSPTYTFPALLTANPTGPPSTDAKVPRSVPNVEYLIRIGVMGDAGQPQQGESWIGFECEMH